VEEEVRDGVNAGMTFWSEFPLSQVSVKQLCAAARRTVINAHKTAARRFCKSFEKATDQAAMSKCSACYGRGTSRKEKSREGNDAQQRRWTRKTQRKSRVPSHAVGPPAPPQNTVTCGSFLGELDKEILQEELKYAELPR
jgi:hypothetical protein